MFGLRVTGVDAPRSNMEVGRKSSLAALGFWKDTKAGANVTFLLGDAFGILSMGSVAEVVPLGVTMMSLGTARTFLGGDTDALGVSTVFGGDGFLPFFLEGLAKEFELP